MARILGIDLGSHSVKVAVYEGNFGRFQLDGYLHRPVAQDVDVAPELDERLATLGQLLDELGAGSWTESAVNYSSEWASIRLVNLPFTDRDQVEQTLQFEVENQVPFDLEEMILASRILSVGASGSTVLTALAERERIRPLLEGLKAVGVDPKLLVLDADLLSDYADEGVQAVVDFGHTRSLVALCRDGNVIGARAISIGGRSLTRALARELELSWEEAEERKHASSLRGTAPAAPSSGPTPAEVQWANEEGDTSDDLISDWMDEPTTQIREPQPAGEIELPEPVAAPPVDAPPEAVPPVHGGRREAEILRKAVEPLLVELRATLISLEDSYDVEIDELIICGGGASLQGLRSWASEVLDVPVRHAQISDEADMLEARGRFALSHSLARKAGRSSRGRLLDLRRDEFAFRGDLATLGNLARYGAVAVVFFLLAGVAMFTYRHHQLSRELAALDEQVRSAVLETFPDVPPDKLTDATMALAIMQEKTTETTGRVKALGSIVSDEPPMLGLLKDISEGMPAPGQARIDVRELSVTQTNITIKAETDGYEAATRIESALQAHRAFKQARKGDEKKSKDGVRFDITIPRGESAETDEG